MGRLGQEVVRAREYDLCELWDVLCAAVARGDSFTADLYAGAMALRILGGGEYVFNDTPNRPEETFG